MTVMSTRPMPSPGAAASAAVASGRPSPGPAAGHVWRLLAGDLTAIVPAVAASAFVATRNDGGDDGAGLLLGVGLALTWLVALGSAGSYRQDGFRTRREQLRPVAVAAGVSSALVAGPSLLLSDQVQTRTALELALLFALTLAARLVLVGSDRRRAPLRLMLAGSADGVLRAQEHFANSRDTRRVTLVHSSIDTQAGPIPRARSPHQATAAPASADRVSSLLREVEAHDVRALLVVPSLGLPVDEMRRLAWELADRQVELLLSTDSVAADRSRLRSLDLNGLNAVHVAAPQLSGPSKALKSIVERVAAGLGVLVLSPLLAAIAVAIRCTSSGPALFQQARTGLDGVPFVVYKFRTMRQGSAEQFLALAEQAGQDSMFFKLERDPRITRFGAFLRKTSLDELPQLFNVVLGNMSLIGPRPLPAEVDQSSGRVHRRLRVLPGITGLWQVSGRSSIKGDQALEYDIDYVDNWRLGLDVSILRRTVRAVVRSDGAY
ncbi:MAG: hypothetical protein QOG60_587 [Frankiaceae bacterium]|nr:hypothetical protein [Frankiaceae bacterium]